MASSITTQAHVLTYSTVTNNELGRVETDRMEKDNWASVHAKAWTLIKGMLLMRRPPLKEADIDDTTELIPVTVFAALYLAYNESEIISDDDKARKSYWYRKMRKVFSEVLITSNSTVLPRESYSGRRSLRA